MSLRRYPIYKSSAVKWLGELPEHWHVTPLKRLLEIQNGVDHKQVEQDVGYPVYGSGGVFAFARDFLYDGESVLLGRKGTIDRPIHVVGRFWAVDTMYWSKIRPGVSGRFLYYSALTIPFGYYSTNTALPSMTKGVLDRHLVALPPLGEQKDIAAFLDRETAKIDGLVTEQQRLIELLKEKRQAIIARSVTKGLNRHVPMKYSGVAWLGDIPEHWQTCSSRRLFAVRREPAAADDKVLTASQKYGVLYQSDFVEREGRRVVEVIMGLDSLLHVEPDDFIISMRSFQGGLEWSRLRGSTSFHYVIVRAIKDVYPPFFAHLFKSATYIHSLRRTTDLIRDGQELRYSNFVQVDLPVIPMDEQRSIAAYLDTEARRLDSLVSEAGRAIDLLHERRSALISAAVTGQIDVRGIAKQEAA